VPELPEVETMRRGILCIAPGQIADVDFPQCRCRPIQIFPAGKSFRKRLIGRTVTSIDRIGKRLLMRLDTRDAIVIEPRMTGLVLISDPPNEEHLRIGFFFSTQHRWLWYWDRRGLGSVKVLSESMLESELGPNRIGPDALSASAAQLQQRLSHSRRMIKVALLDQSALAGIGNLYASEILHEAGIHPELSCDRLSHVQWRRIHTAMQKVLQDAIRYEGSTLADGTYRSALNTFGSYQNHHRVYGRSDLPCPRCGTSIQRTVLAQRSTYFCPRCQKSKHRPEPALPAARSRGSSQQ
jgi:formamidopyrimidine-DNA glycosylase